MNPKQKIATLPRWLINIGLTLQFYIPGVILLGFAWLTLGGVLFGEHVCGVSAAFGIISLFILLGASVWYGIYLLMNRYDSPCDALIFLVTINFAIGLIWLTGWVSLFSQVISYEAFGIQDLLFLLLISPAPLIVSTLFYMTALSLMRSKPLEEC